MADPVGVQLRDRLEDALGSVGLAGVDGLAEEAPVRVARRRPESLPAGRFSATASSLRQAVQATQAVQAKQPI